MQLWFDEGRRKEKKGGGGKKREEEEKEEINERKKEGRLKRGGGRVKRDESSSEVSEEDDGESDESESDSEDDTSEEESSSSSSESIDDEYESKRISADESASSSSHPIQPLVNEDESSNTNVSVRPPSSAKSSTQVVSRANRMSSKSLSNTRSKMSPVDSAAMAATSTYIQALAADACDPHSHTADESTQLLAAALKARRKDASSRLQTYQSPIHHVDRSSSQLVIGTPLSSFAPPHKSRPPFHPMNGARGRTTITTTTTSSSLLSSQSSSTTSSMKQLETVSSNHQSSTHSSTSSSSSSSMIERKFFRDTIILQQQFEMIRDIFEEREEEILYGGGGGGGSDRKRRTKSKKKKMKSNKKKKKKKMSEKKKMKQSQHYRASSPSPHNNSESRYDESKRYSNADEMAWNKPSGIAPPSTSQQYMNRGERYASKVFNEDDHLQQNPSHPFVPMTSQTAPIHSNQPYGSFFNSSPGPTAPAVNPHSNRFNSNIPSGHPSHSTPSFSQTMPPPSSYYGKHQQMSVLPIVNGVNAHAQSPTSNGMHINSSSTVQSAYQNHTPTPPHQRQYDHPYQHTPMRDERFSGPSNQAIKSSMVNGYDSRPPTAPMSRTFITPSPPPPSSHINIHPIMPPQHHQQYHHAIHQQHPFQHNNRPYTR